MAESPTTLSQFRAEKPDDLLRTQDRAVRGILKQFAKIAKDVLDHPSVPKVAPEPRRDVIRPHHVFTIDGARGSGKTYTLLSLENAIQGFSDFWRDGGQEASNNARRWHDFLGRHIGQPTLGTFNALRGPSPYTNGLAQILSIIFPGDMEGHESLMEAIFAAMMEQLNTAAQSKDKVEKANELRNRLRTKVAQGWYFARDFGHDSIVRDSIDYTDYIEKLEIETRKAARRTEVWRGFLVDYLNFHDVATLAIMVDDSDVKPELTSDILHSIRMFLNHPRLFTVLAGNIRAMRSILVHHAMRPLGQSMLALSDISGPTANDWRRTERKAVEDYMEKVLPLAQRFFVSPPSLHSVDDNSSDFTKITGRAFPKVCAEMLARERAKFLDEKFHLAIARATGKSDVPGEQSRRTLEAYLAWWVFFDRYAFPLAPKSARQIVTFDKYYRDFSLQDGSPPSSSHPKRLIIALFENPANYPLIHQFSDEDANVVTWLQHQSLRSTWVGERKFEVNSRIINRGQYSYEYIRFRLDVGLAAPVRDNAEEVVPRELLPAPKGRRYMRRFFHPQRIPRRQRGLGVARWIDHAVIPGNCLYFYDLESLPDSSLIAPTELTTVRTLQSGAWEAELADNWVEVIENVQNIQEDFIYRYFTEVVCISQRPTAEVPTGELIALLDPPSIARQQEEATYEDFWRDEFVSFKQSDPAQLWNSTERRSKRRVAMYAALITDIRRAWHAIRIYEHSPWKIGALPTLVGSPPSSFSYTEDDRASFIVISAQDRLHLYTRDQIEELLRGTDWTKNLLEVFSRVNVTKTFATFLANVPYPELDGATDWQAELLRNLSPLRLSSLYSAEYSDLEAVDGGVLGRERRSRPIFEDHRDFRNWRASLRALGRIACEAWPGFMDAVTEDAQERDPRPSDHQWVKSLQSFENKLFEHRLGYRMSIFNFKDDQANDEHARAARNFVWLLYGLIPSLPAVIHTHIMGLIYHAELSFPHREEGSGGDPALLKESLDNVIELYKNSLTEIDKWAELVGQLSATLRYIWEKYRHLHVGLALSSMPELVKKDEDEMSSMSELVKKDEDQNCVIFLNRYGYITQNGETIPNEEAKLVFDKHMKQLFVGERALATNLAIMPDVASSTLFGEHWLAYVLDGLVSMGKLNLGRMPSHGTERYSFPSGYVPPASEPLPEPPDPFPRVSGVFAETEMWLWATNRFLRKLKGEISRVSRERQQEPDKLQPNQPPRSPRRRRT